MHFTEIKGALIGTTNIGLLPKVGQGVVIHLNDTRLQMEFDDVIKSIPVGNVLNTTVNSNHTNGFMVYEFWTRTDIYYVALMPTVEQNV